MKNNLTLISAGAGSGKTYRVTQLLKEELVSGRIRPDAVIATTFTRKAANELVERVRSTLAEQGRFDLAAAMNQAMIGTVNGICGQLLSRFAFNAGLSPRLRVVDETAAALLFSQALEHAISSDLMDRLNRIGERLGVEDWRKDVKQLADLARNNAIHPQVLSDQATSNADALLTFFPAATERDIDSLLVQTVQDAIAEISSNGDSTKTTADYLQVLQQRLPRLKQKQASWIDWIKLSKGGAAKRSAEAADKVRTVALEFDCHPGFQADLRQFVLDVFAAAQQTLTDYDQFKTERGLIDFVDQEQKVLQLLEQAEVAEAIREEFDLLLVDEFQDTSPLQLAIFLKLMSLVNKSVWVGDVKQAIYGFRGCDPELMKAVVTLLRDTGGVLDILPNSYRSTPELVQLSNALFVPAFADILSASEVQLSATRNQRNPQSALEFWQLGGKNQQLQANALAEGISRLLEEGQQIEDKVSRQMRQLGLRDIAVLCRTNTAAVTIATALADQGLPVSIGRPGLLETPEATLSLACLRRLLDPSDTLASAEILSLCSTQDIEEWLTDRMQWLADRHPSASWKVAGEQADPVLKALAEARSRLAILSPSEALDLALRIGNVEQHAHCWGPTAARARERLANIDALRGLATTYEDYCGQSAQAATVAGLLLWLQDLAAQQQDHCGIHSTAEAITVMTHHGAKGLEWPVVILCDLHKLYDNAIWGAGIKPSATGIDLSNPLQDRQLHYWPWPFGNNKKGIAVADRIADSDAAQQALAGQRAEDLRLLYVSMTRARDLLVLALPDSKKSFAWLNLLGADWLTPAQDTLTLPDGTTIPVATKELSAPEFNLSDADQTSPLSWFSMRKPHQQRPPRDLSPSSIETPTTAAIGKILHLGNRLPINGAPEMDCLGTAIHDLLAADFSGALASDSTNRIATLLDSNGLQGVVDPTAAADLPMRLRSVLQQQFGATAFYPEWPIEYVLANGQRIKGWIDLLVDTPAGWLVIDHKTYPGKSLDWQKQALAYAGQLAAYRQALVSTTDRSVAGTWIHFCVSGGLVEVVI